MPEHTPAPTHARSLYGFFMYLFSKTALCVYCIWAFTPDSVLHYFNIYYYPQKYWSTAIPIQCLVALTLFAFIIYPSLNLILTPVIDSVNTLNDIHSHYNSYSSHSSASGSFCICNDVNKCMKDSYKINSMCDKNKISHLSDLDIRFVCRKLYINK